MEKTRPKIIFAVMILAIVYGGYELVFDHRPKTVASAATDSGLQEYTAKIGSSIARNAPSSYDTCIVTRASKTWARNPFVLKVQPDDTKKTKDAGLAQFVYQGYIETPSRRMAVINNAEYKSGEQLVQKGFFVKLITPTTVTIINKRDRTKVTVPLSD